MAWQSQFQGYASDGATPVLNTMAMNKQPWAIIAGFAGIIHRPKELNDGIR